MKLTEKQRNFIRFIGIRFADFAIRMLIGTLRIKFINEEALLKAAEEKKNYVSAFWHGSMMIGWFINRKNNPAALVSRSRDGDVLAAVLGKWNYNIVRGSSSTGGQDALTSMVFLLRDGYSIAITPDGPRGPAYKMKAGAVIAAKKAGVPLFLAGIGMKNKIVLKSWDRFEVPLPFSRVSVIYSDPLFIDENLNYDETNNKLIESEELLSKLQREALKLC
jgi:lysophospholipid acyltransferase (LPLAT)-like uncharacterized protein